MSTKSDVASSFAYVKAKNKVGSFLTKYSFKNIYSRLGRTIFSFIALILCFTLIFIMFNYIAYDPAYYIINNLTTYGIRTSEVYLNKQQSYYDGIALHDVVDDDNNYYPFIDTTTLVYNGSYLNFTVDFLVTKSETITYLDETYLVPEDELLVFDYVKEYIDTLSLANQLSVRDLNGTIHDINISSTTIATDVVGVQEHGYAFLSFDHFMSLSNNDVPIVARAPQKIGNDTTSLDLQTFYRYDNQNLVEGNPIENDDEIIVSTNFVDKFISNNVNYNDVIGKKFIIPAYSTYADEIKYDENCRYFDLQKLFGEVTIVGVSDDANADIYLSSTSFGVLYEQRISRYHVFIMTPNMHDKINYLYSNDVWLNNDYSTPIYSFAKIFKQNLSIVFIIVTILTFIIATFILLNWVITIIKDRYREIAIMKCLGLNDKKIYPTFSSMILIISSFCTIIALVAGAALTPLLNLSYTSMLSISANSLVYTFNIYSFLVPILFFFIVPPLLTLIFVKQINKLEPYDALKEFR